MAAKRRRNKPDSNDKLISLPTDELVPLAIKAADNLLERGRLQPKTARTRAYSIAGEFVRRRDEYKKFKQGDNSDEKLDSTFRLGFLARSVIDAERHVVRSIKGGHKRSDSPERNYKYFQSMYQEDVEKLMAEDGILYTAACERVAKDRRVKSRTVRQHTDRKKAIASVAGRAKRK